MLDAALQYAAHGYRIIPVAGKRPITPNGKSDASSNPAIIKAWWEGSPTSGIGIVIPDDIVVVDVDSADALKSLSEFGLDLPTTAKAKSKRGWHFWYRRISKTPALRKIAIFPGLDLLVNGYVVAPPTKGYEWELSIIPNDNIVEAPEWLETSITQSEKEHSRVNPEEVLNGLPLGARNTGLFRYACALRSREKTSAQEAKILLREAARHAEGTVSSDYTDRLVDRVWKTYAAKERREEKEAKHPKPRSLAELAAEPLVPNVSLVNKLVPSYGYTLVTSPPKTGKSALVQYVAACIATGKSVWDRYNVKHTGVLYLDLEQSPYDAQIRWRTILDKMGVEVPPSNLYVEFHWPALDDGGIDLLKEFLIEHPNVNLIVVDTLADFWPADEGGNSNAYHREQRIVKQFLPLSRDYGCSIILVHHDSKSDRKEIAAKASGTYALTGKASAIWHLSREEDRETGYLEVTGKNIPDNKWKLKFHPEDTFWEFIYGYK